jgi:hypothetical protein
MTSPASYWVAFTTPNFEASGNTNRDRGGGVFTPLPRSSLPSHPSTPNRLAAAAAGLARSSLEISG